MDDSDLKMLRDVGGGHAAVDNKYLMIVRRAYLCDGDNNMVIIYCSD